MKNNEGKMGNVVVVGAQWGDEGKAKITDLLSKDANFIIRYQGGCNAGHTVVVGDETYKFHLIPSGVLNKDKKCFIGSGVVIHPETFKKEIDDLKARNIDLSNLKISPLASITMPYHVDLDGASESSQNENKIGTTKKGIGPTYSDKIARVGLKVQDLFDEELSNKLDKILPLKNSILTKVYGLNPYSKDEILKLCKEYAGIFEPYVCENWQDFLLQAKNNGNILFEGAQGVMLDVDFGTYPYVTSSNPIAGGASTGSGLGPNVIDDVIGVFKAYITRVGEGPFVTELDNETGKKIQTIGVEFGTTTGRARRCGWFDAVVAKYSALVSGITQIALTKIDVFDTFDEIKLCTSYRDKRNGKIYTNYPTNVSLHKHLEPIYETFEGWKTDISKIKNYKELPQNLITYLKRIEQMVGAKVTIISVGPKREQTIMLDNPFEI